VSLGVPPTDPRIDTYIAASADFARPILKQLRQLVHTACPQVEETIKWSRPFFLYQGQILANMSAFKHHCSFGFWGSEAGKALEADAALKPGAMGSLGRITALTDLPPEKKFLACLRKAAAEIESGRTTTVMSPHRVVKAPQPAPEPPAEFLAALGRNPQAKTVYNRFSPSCKREYIDWIAEAKRTETRDRRIQQAIDWIAEGKQRHWKYQA
jgi:uncharacterized protein YdeI (YjbR/CyaY-like superfamily)